MINVLHDIVYRGAERFADRVAFRFQQESMTYSELERNSERIAAILQENGSRKGDRVGILMRKSLEMPEAVYGVLRAGGAYVPLDVTAPAERTATIISDCGIKSLVVGSADARSVDKVLGLVDRELLVLGAENVESESHTIVTRTELRRFTGAAIQVDVGPDDLAYLLYTSGSTGVPKGIVHTHLSGVAYAVAAAQQYGITEEDRLSGHPPLHFDMSLFDLFSGPAMGASSSIISAGVSKMPASMSSLIESDSLTIWYSVPFALIQMLQNGVLEERDCTSLRWVLFAGEAFPVKHLRKLMEAWPQAEFANIYGPSEVNQCTHYHVPRSGWKGDQDSLPIGNAWPAARVLVVDGDGESVSGSTVGELLVDTSTMMKEYWNRPDLTKSAIEYRTENGKQIRYHRTGDLVYRNPDNELMFVGRRDHQVKTRGYRVELSGVEAALMQHPAVNEAVAVPIEVEPGLTLIFAAAVLQAEVGEGTLIRHAQANLPAYAVPQTISIVDRFPRTATGKVDRRSLADSIRNEVQA